MALEVARGRATTPQSAATFQASSMPKERVNGMLVLSRKKNESIVINDSIIVTVVEIRGDKVRLGIQAPKEVPVHRSEVHAAIHTEQASHEHPAEA